MASAQKFVFTALPAFRTVKDKYDIVPYVSAFVTIQLEASEDSTLHDFPDIKNWIEKLAKTNFRLRINNREDFTVSLVNHFDEKMYNRLFSNEIKVRGYNKEEQDLTKFPIKSYPIKHISGFIENAFQKVGIAKSDVLPTEEYFSREWLDLNNISEWSIINPITLSANKPFTENQILEDSDLKTLMNEMRNNTVVIPFNEQPETPKDFAQIKNFHLTDKNIKDPPQKPDFDYHDIISVLSGYPLLQRKFGLVLDFDLPEEAIAALGSEGTIRIIPNNISFKNSATISCPAVAYERTEKNEFYLESTKDSVIEKGLIKINNEADFGLVQYDTDGAALKLCNQADNLILSRARHLSLLSEAPVEMKNQEEYENYNQRNEGLPTLRSSGIGVVRNGLANVLFNKFQRNKGFYDVMLPESVSSLEDPITKVTIYFPTDDKDKRLYANDLVQGYRMDVYDHAYKLAHPEEDGWFSLHRRIGTYSYAPVGNIEKLSLGDNEEDEGFIQISAAQERSGNKALAVGETIARWEGWSLSVRKPGIAINNSTDPNEVNNETEEKKKYLLPDSVAFRLEANSKIVKGSLPKLRFGRKYKIKLRVVDLAGNSLPYDYIPEKGDDVISKDIVYLRYEPTPTPVIKYASEIKDGESLERMVIRSNIDSNAEEYENKVSDRIKFLPVATRHFQAPRTTQFMAELHDMFEGIGMAKTEIQKIDYGFIHSKDAEKFNNYVKTDNIEGPKSFEEAGRFVYPDVRNLPLTYLADPMAAGVVFFLDNDSDIPAGWTKSEPKYCSFYTDKTLTDNSVNLISKEEWKEPKSFRILLKEGNQNTEWDVAERKLVVYLEQGTIVTLNYASFWWQQDIHDKSGLFQILRKSPEKATKQFALSNAEKGKHWMISPWRKLALVHAVQQPLEAPQIFSLTVSRSENETTAYLDSEITLHGKSTNKINIEAKWKEHMDDFADIGPKITDSAAHVVSIPVEYFTERITGNAAACNTDKIKKVDLIIHQFGDTKHRWIEYKPVATSRYREYFTGILKNKTGVPKKDKDLSLISEGPVFKDDNTVDPFNNSNNGKVNVLSSARPAVPLVDYVLPSFNWASKPKFSDGGNTETHFRTGNIRVYLKRPWFSSGEGERLGVVFCMEGHKSDDRQHSFWGKDPIFTGGALAPNNTILPVPDDSTFPFSAEKDIVSLGEDKVKVFAYNGLYDAERQLYYADIPVNSYGAYFPFLKLALCRYQRHSLRNETTDLCISGIVQTDWIQIVPPRSVTVTTNVIEKNKFSVTIKGPSSFIQNVIAANASAHVIRNRIKILVEKMTIPKTDEAFVRVQNKQLNTVVWEKEFDITDEQIVNETIQFNTSVDFGKEYNKQPFRIVIEEYELHRADPLRSQNIKELKERLVFMDVFEVNAKY